MTETTETLNETLNIGDLLVQNPFDGVEQDQHIQIDEMLDKSFTILDIEPFESVKKGPGVYVLIDLDGDIRYICTHAISLTSKLPGLKKYIDDGKQICARIGKRPSQNDKSRKVYYLY